MGIDIYWITHPPRLACDIRCLLSPPREASAIRAEKIPNWWRQSAQNSGITSEMFLTQKAAYIKNINS